MAADKSTFKNAIKAAYEAAQGIEDPVEAADTLADQIANAIEAFIKSGDVGFTTGNVSGTCPSGGGALTAGAATGGKWE